MTRIKFIRHFSLTDPEQPTTKIKLLENDKRLRRQEFDIVEINHSQNKNGEKFSSFQAIEFNANHLTKTKF